MQAHQQVEVGRHDAQLQEARALLPRDDRQVLREIGGTGPIEGGSPLPGTPDDVDEESMIHSHGGRDAPSGEYHGNAGRVA